MFYWPLLILRLIDDVFVLVFLDLFVFIQLGTLASIQWLINLNKLI